MSSFWEAWRGREPGGKAQRSILCVLLYALLMASVLSAGTPLIQAQALATTTVQDTIYRADGMGAAGSAVISWGAFTTSAGAEVQAGSTTATLGAGGALAVSLAPNAGAVPMGSYYTVIFHLSDGTVQKEFWVVPVTVAGGGPVHLSSVRNQVLPTSVAMQSVTKSYVDAAIARAQLSPLDSSPYVMKSGDTMTGPLVLPGDPATPQQAADKSYVDTSLAAVQSGLNGKVALLPPGSQTIGQPLGTELAVTRENGAVNAAALYDNVAGVNAASILAGPDCADECRVVVGADYPGVEFFQTGEIPVQGRLVDERRGSEDVLTRDTGGIESGLTATALLNLTTADAATYAGLHGNVPVGSTALQVSEVASAGGANQQPQDVETVPYFKSTYGALSMMGDYHTPGQHITENSVTHCYSVGDCLDDTHILWTSGDFHDESDEGTHPGDQFVSEDSNVVRGTCQSGCTAGSTHLTIQTYEGGGTEGEGRYLLDMNPAKDILNATIVSGDTNSYPFNEVTLAGASFSASTFLQTAAAATSQPSNLAPGTVTLPIATSGVPAGFVTNTAALPASSGVACIADPTVHTFAYFETTNYTVVDASHIQLTLRYVHHNGATISVGGLCGYGIEQTVDTRNGFRQVFPIVGTLSATQVLYADSHTGALGLMGLKSGYANYSQSILSVTRSGGVSTVTLAGGLGGDLSGLTLSLSGIADPSFNGSFAITMTSDSTFTYANSGPDASSTGGTAAYATPGVAIYPMAEARNVFDAATGTVDDTMDLTPNTVPWASGDAVEMPHYFSLNAHADTELILQTIPRPDTALNSAGKSFGGNVGPGLDGWSIQNTNAASEYVGGGGTHFPPGNAFVAGGVWQDDMLLTAGEDAVFRVTCNLHGCGRYDSGYDLFLLQRVSGYDQIRYDPASSTLSMGLGAGFYSFTPSAFSASSINVGTLHATTISGATFGASGTAHATGLVPDPGGSQGTTRFLREDGTWSAPSGGGGSAAPMTNVTGGTNNYAPIANPSFTGDGGIAGSWTVSGGTLNATTLNGGSEVDITIGGTNNVFRGGRANAWSDNVPSQFFQVGNVSDNVAFTGKSGAPLSRLQFSAAHVQINPNYFDGLPPPASTALFAVGSANQFQVDGSGAVSGKAFQETLFTPASSSAACTAGQFGDDANFHYVCVAANTWKRAALSAF